MLGKRDVHAACVSRNAQIVNQAAGTLQELDRFRKAANIAHFSGFGRRLQVAPYRTGKR